MKTLYVQSATDDILFNNAAIDSLATIDVDASVELFNAELVARLQSCLPGYACILTPGRCYYNDNELSLLVADIGHDLYNDGNIWMVEKDGE